MTCNVLYHVISAFQFFPGQLQVGQFSLSRFFYNFSSLSSRIFLISELHKLHVGNYFLAGFHCKFSILEYYILPPYKYASRGYFCTTMAGNYILADFRCIFNLWSYFTSFLHLSGQFCRKMADTMCKTSNFGSNFHSSFNKNL